MRRTKPVSRIAGGRANQVEAEKRLAGGEQGDFRKSTDGTYSYTTRAGLRDPKTGRRVPTSVGIVVSDGSVMMWVKT